jgi:hypothetical protein
MKYLFACLIIPTVQALFVVAIMLGALYFGAEHLLARMKAKRYPAESEAALAKLPNSGPVAP